MQVFHTYWLFWLSLAWAVILKWIHVEIARYADTYSPDSEVFRIFGSFPAGFADNGYASNVESMLWLQTRVDITKL